MVFDTGMSMGDYVGQCASKTMMVMSVVNVDCKTVPRCILEIFIARAEVSAPTSKATIVLEARGNAPLVFPLTDVVEGTAIAVGVDVVDAEGGGTPLYWARMMEAACSARPYVGACSYKNPN